MAIQQRTHERDVIGHLRDKGEWDEVILPAIAQEHQCLPLYNGNFFEREPGDILAPSAESAETLEEIKATMGAQAFSGQYLQNPVAPGGNRVQWDWFLVYDQPFRREELQYVVQSWDTALSELPGSDYSVCVTLGFYDGHWYVLDVLRRRISFTAQCTEAERLYRRWRPDMILVEQASTGGALADHLRRKLQIGRRSILAWPARLGKEERVEVFSHRIEQGLIVIPQSAPWLAEFRREITAFPADQHDDQVDALFQVLEWLDSPRGRGATNIDPLTGRSRLSGRPRGRDYSRLAG